ncbi:hypothetical protein Cni_G22238 [Canna indica]|uniref:Uncharacterized protein n=1 Tax=Canna indica TaxID=4628 RepID=A0AAQ3QL10_9LILI|nr:hypothetical protein Cni_G22238 [Canna indica]
MEKALKSGIAKGIKEELKGKNIMVNMEVDGSLAVRSGKIQKQKEKKGKEKILVSQQKERMKVAEEGMPVTKEVCQINKKEVSDFVFSAIEEDTMTDKEELVRDKEEMELDKLSNKLAASFKKIRQK